MERSSIESAANLNGLAERIWQEHRGWVAAVIRAHAPRGPAGHVDHDDLLQEVAMTLVSRIDTLESMEKIGPWLRTVAMNAARDAGRRKRTADRAMARDAAREQADGRFDGSGAEAARQRGRQALAIAESLPIEYREPLLLSLRGLRYRQIAEIMDVPVTTIETRLHRARKMVREELEAAERKADSPLRFPGTAKKEEHHASEAAPTGRTKS